MFQYETLEDKVKKKGKMQKWKLQAHHQLNIGNKSLKQELPEKLIPSTCLCSPHFRNGHSAFSVSSPFQKQEMLPLPLCFRFYFSSSTGMFSCQKCTKDNMSAFHLNAFHFLQRKGKKQVNTAFRSTLCFKSHQMDSCKFLPLKLLYGHRICGSGGLPSIVQGFFFLSELLPFTSAGNICCHKMCATISLQYFFLDVSTFTLFSFGWGVHPATLFALRASFANSSWSMYLRHQEFSSGCIVPIIPCYGTEGSNLKK